jgi:hypothetical protein
MAVGPSARALTAVCASPLNLGYSTCEAQLNEMAPTELAHRKRLRVGGFGFVPRCSLMLRSSGASAPAAAGCRCGPTCRRHRRPERAGRQHPGAGPLQPQPREGPPRRAQGVLRRYARLRHRPPQGARRAASTRPRNRPPTQSESHESPASLSARARPPPTPDLRKRTSPRGARHSG